MSLGLVLLALIVLAAAAEAVIFIAKDMLPSLHGEDKLSASMTKAQNEVAEVGKTVKARADKLSAILGEVEKLRDEFRSIEHDFEAKRQIPPILVHAVGVTGKGTRFRAPLAKELPAEPDPTQKLIWERKNFVDVWAPDPGSARDAAQAQYPALNGYQIGQFAPAPKPPPRAGGRA